MFKKAMIASAMLAAAVGAQAQTAPNASWAVGGTINPATCTLGLTGSADFGTLTQAEVMAWGASTSAGVPTRNNGLQRTLTLSAVCPSATKMALSFVDGKSGTSVTTSSSAYNPYAFGLGNTTIAGTATKIGFYLMTYTGLQIKATSSSTAAAPATKLTTTGAATSSSTWAAAAAGNASTFVAPGSSYAFSATAAATTPDSLVEISGPLVLQPGIATSVLTNATAPIQLDGAGTVTLLSL